MVIKSSKDFNGWKEEVRDIYYNKFPSKKSYIDKFIDFTDERLKPFERSFLSYRLLWYLYERRKNVVKNQHYWVAFIGRKGGEGKSTLGKHILYYMDKTFNPNKRCVVSYKDFVKQVKHTKQELKIKYPSILIDEPENKIHILSKEGRKLRDILGKIRQLNLFVGICANSLSDVPSFIYHRLSCIVFIDEKHRFWVWDNMKDKPSYTVIEDIKKGFKKMGHAIFKDRFMLKRAIIKNMTFSPLLPWSETEYLENKHNDLFKDLDEFVYDEKEEQKKPIPNKILAAKLLKNNPNITGAKLGELLGLSPRTGQYLKKQWTQHELRRNNNKMGEAQKI